MWQRSPIVSALGASGIVFSAIFSIYLYNRLFYGIYSPHLGAVKDVTRREFNVLIALLIPTVLLGIFPNVILDTFACLFSDLLVCPESTVCLQTTQNIQKKLFFRNPSCSTNTPTKLQTLQSNRRPYLHAG